MGDFGRTDAALQRWLQGPQPRRVEIAAQLYAEAGCTRTASTLALHALETLPIDHPASVGLMGFVDPSEPIPQLRERIDAAPPGDAVRVSGLAQLLIQRGEFDLARRMYVRGLDAWPDSVRLLGELAELLLWAGELDEAEEPIRRLAGGDAPHAAILETTRHLARAALEEADAALRAVPREARSGARYVLLRAELLVRRGKLRSARRLMTEASGTHGLVAGRILSAMCALRCGEPDRAVTGEDEEHGWIRRGELIALTPQEPGDIPSEPEALWGRLQRALESLRGNRSATPTVAGANGAPLIVLRPVPDMRQRAVAVLASIVHREPERVLHDFEALLTEHPGAAHPRCYRGELLLWLGRYDEAEADFIAAREISPLRRWAIRRLERRRAHARTAGRDAGHRGAVRGDLRSQRGGHARRLCGGSPPRARPPAAGDPRARRSPDRTIFTAGRGHQPRPGGRWTRGRAPPRGRLAAPVYVGAGPRIGCSGPGAGRTRPCRRPGDVPVPHAGKPLRRQSCRTWMRTGGSEPVRLVPSG